MRLRTVITAASVPRIVRGARLKRDDLRKAWIILAPERIFVLDDIAAEVMQTVDGDRTVEAMAELLSARFGAPQGTVLADVIGMLQDLCDKGALAA